jgi:hypothetical protein
MQLATASYDKTVRIWNLDPRNWQQRACSIANRNLTREEWRKYMGAQPYRKTCPDLPAPDDARSAVAIQPPQSAGKSPNTEPAPTTSWEPKSEITAPPDAAQLPFEKPAATAPVQKDDHVKLMETKDDAN